MEGKELFRLGSSIRTKRGGSQIKEKKGVMRIGLVVTSGSRRVCTWWADRARWSWEMGVRWAIGGSSQGEIKGYGGGVSRAMTPKLEGDVQEI